MAVELLVSAVGALVRGAQGGRFWRKRDARPFLDRAQRLLDGNRAWAPRAVWDECAHDVAELRDLHLISDEDAQLQLLLPWNEGVPRDATRACSACGVRAMEMMLCSRCRGTPAQIHYCSPACQRAHWPAHKAACKAAAAAAAAAGAASGSR